MGAIPSNLATSFQAICTIVCHVLRLSTDSCRFNAAEVEMFMHQCCSGFAVLLWTLWQALGPSSQGKSHKRSKGSEAKQGRYRSFRSHQFSTAIRRVCLIAITCTVFFQPRCTECRTQFESCTEEPQDVDAPEGQQVREDRNTYRKNPGSPCRSCSDLASLCEEQSGNGSTEIPIVFAVSQCNTPGTSHLEPRAPGVAFRPAAHRRVGFSSPGNTRTGGLHVTCCTWSHPKYQHCSPAWRVCSTAWESIASGNGCGPSRTQWWPRLPDSQHSRARGMDFEPLHTNSHACTKCTDAATGFACTDPRCHVSAGTSTHARYHSTGPHAGTAAEDAISHTQCSAVFRSKARFPSTWELGRTSRQLSKPIVQSTPATVCECCTGIVRSTKHSRSDGTTGCPKCSSGDADAPSSPRGYWRTRPHSSAAVAIESFCRTTDSMPAKVARFKDAGPTGLECAANAKSINPSDGTSHSDPTASFARVCRHHVNQQLPWTVSCSSQNGIDGAQPPGTIFHVPTGTAYAKGCQNTRWIFAPASGLDASDRAPEYPSARFLRIANASADRGSHRRRAFFRGNATPSDLRVALERGPHVGNPEDVPHMAWMLNFDQPQQHPTVLQREVNPTIRGQGQPQGLRQIIRLEEQLQWTSQENALLESHMLFKQLSQRWPFTAAFWNLDFMDLLPDIPPEAKYVLQEVRPWTSSDVCAVHIYVDGSSFANTKSNQADAVAGWAFTVVVERRESHSNKFQFYCASCGPLMSDTMPNACAFDVGELLHDSLSAEAVAMIWTLSWVTQMPFQAPVIIYYDNMTIGHFSSGRASWNASWEYAKLHSALSALRQCLQAQGRSVGFEHQKSHCKHPWSDLVDAIAKAAAKRILHPLQLPLHVPRVVTHVAFKFAWLALLPQDEIPFPAAMPGTLKAEGPFGSFPLDLTWNHTPEETHTLDIQVTLSFASANVLTLSGGPKNRQLFGLLEQGRIASLQAQFSEEKCSFVGLQECRTFGQNVRHSSSHWVFQSGASSEGHRGCELWVDRSLPYAVSKSKKFFFQGDHFHVSDFSDRHLMVMVSAPHLNVRLLVIHAPHEHATDVAFESWWNWLSTLVTTIQPQMPLIIMGDTNGRLGSVRSDAVSDLGRENENAAGHCLHAFLLEHQMFVPSSMMSIM